MTTIVFPGQGSQFVQMSKDFYDMYPEAREVFNLVKEFSKIDIKDIIFNNPSDLINQTKYTQLAIFCSSMAIYRVLIKEFKSSELNISCMMGHSLGEYSALTACGFLKIEDCSILLKKRGELMQNAFEPNKSGMAAIIGKDCKFVEGIIEKNHLNIQVANDNSPMQVVISGINSELKNAEIIFQKAEIKKFIFLNVSAAFHSNLMINAQNEMNKYIYNTNFNKAKTPIISNYSAKLSNDINILIDNLSKQMSNKVRWAESIKTLEKNNERKIIEIGPGKVLSGLIKRISNKFHIVNLEHISDIEKINEL